MKAGMVIQIRVNPGDCQSILDLMGLLTVDPYDGRSFAQCVSLALSSMLGSYRKSTVLPEVDPFQYLNRMGPFLSSGNNKKKFLMAEALYRNGGHSVAMVELPEVKQPGQYIPEHLQQQGWTESGPVTTANVPLLLDISTEDTEILVAEFHRLKGSKSLVDKNRSAQISKELDRRNNLNPT